MRPPVSLRVLSAVVGVVTAVSAAVIAAPVLALLSVPFIAAAVALRTGRPLAIGGLVLAAVVHAMLSMQFALANGVSAGWSDLLLVYVGGPLAVAVGVLAVGHLRRGGAVRADVP